MTLIVRRRALIAFTVFVVIAVLGIAAYEYRVIAATESGNVLAKVAAERVLFISILLSGVVAAAGIALVARAIMLSSILDKLVNMNKMSGFSPAKSLDRLGDVGRKINELYRQTADLSAKKSRKISGLSAVVEFLMSISDKPRIVTDSTGRVLYASAPLIERMGEARDALMGRSLVELLPNAEVAETLQVLRRSRDPAALAGSDSVTLSPIRGSDGETHYVVAEIPRPIADEIRSVLTSKPGAVVQGKGRTRMFPLMPRLFGRRGRG